MRDRLRTRAVTEFEIQRRRTKIPGVKKKPLRLGLRWIVEATAVTLMPRPAASPGGETARPPAPQLASAA